MTTGDLADQQTLSASGQDDPEQEAEGAAEDSVQPEELLRSLMEENTALQQENELLATYIERVNPMLVAAAVEDDLLKKKGKGKSRSEPKRDEFKALSGEEKNDIVSNELDFIQTELDKMKVDGDKEIDEIKTLTEEIDMRIAETKKDTYEFKRDIILAAENPRTGKTVAEKMLRYLEDRLRVKDASLDKLKLKNSTVKGQLMKLEQQLLQKEEMGQVLHVVDFDQLKIKNQQYLEKIEEKNSELLTLKLTTGRSVQVLNHLKEQLNALVQRNSILYKEIEDKARQLERFDSEHTAAAADLQETKLWVRRLMLQQEDSDQPQIMDYITLKAEVDELQNKAVDLNRKIEIADMDQARTNRLLRAALA